MGQSVVHADRDVPRVMQGQWLNAWKQALVRFRTCFETNPIARAEFREAHTLSFWHNVCLDQRALRPA